MRTQTRSTLRQAAFCAGFCLTLFSASLLAQETTGDDGISHFTTGTDYASPKGPQASQVLVYRGADPVGSLPLTLSVPAILEITP